MKCELRSQVRLDEPFTSSVLLGCFASAARAQAPTRQCHHHLTIHDETTYLSLVYCNLEAVEKCCVVVRGAVHVVQSGVVCTSRGYASNAVRLESVSKNACCTIEWVSSICIICNATLLRACQAASGRHLV